MKLTPQEEERIIQQFSNKIWELVHRYIHVDVNPLVSKDDCFQECVIVLLKAIRKANSLEELEAKFPYLDMKGAMTRHIVASQHLRYPNTTTNVRKILSIERERQDCTLENVVEDGKEDENLENATMLVDFQRFIGSLDDIERKVVHRKLQGVKNHDIAKELGLSDVKITRMLRRILKKYRIYSAE